MISQIATIVGIIEKAIKALSDSVAAKENPLLKSVVNDSHKLETRPDGTIINNLKNLRIVTSLQTNVEKIIIDTQHKEAVKRFIDAYKEVAETQEKLYSEVAGLEGATKAGNIIKRNAVETTVTNLMQSGIEVGVLDGLKKIMLTNVQGASTMVDLTEHLREYLTTTPGGAGALEKYVSTYSTTAINQYSAEYNKQITNDLGLEWYMYTGSLLETSRDFCIEAVDEIYIHASEFEELLKGHFRNGHKVKLNSKTHLPEGMIEGTSTDTLQRRRGGWNCGHQMIAVVDYIVPQQIKNAVYRTAAYSNWALSRGIVPKKPIDKFTLGFAPFRAKNVSSLKQDEEIRNSPGYKAQQNILTEAAKKLGIKIDDQLDTWGRYPDENGNPIVEVSSVIHIDGTMEQAKVLAALLGKLAPEMQDSVLVATYEGKGQVEHVFKMGNFETAQRAMSLLAEADIQYYSIDNETGDIIIYDLFDDINDKLVSFTDKLNENGIEIKGHEITEISAEFIEHGSYDKILEGQGRALGEEEGFDIDAFVATTQQQNQLAALQPQIADVMQKARDSGLEVQTVSAKYANLYGGTTTPVNYKTESSIQRKVVNELNGDITQLKDSVRSTVVVPYEKLDEVYRALQSDPDFIRVKFQEGSSYMGYRGILANIRTANGTIAEVQFNSPGMMYGKEPREVLLHFLSEGTINNISEQTGLPPGLGHKFYEQARLLQPKVDNGTITDGEIDQLQNIMSDSEAYYRNFYGF